MTKDADICLYKAKQAGRNKVAAPMPIPAITNSSQAIRQASL